MPPTFVPSTLPSMFPSVLPSFEPSTAPTIIPSAIPSFPPTDLPSPSPSAVPSSIPSYPPSHQPSIIPTAIPSDQPTDSPTLIPSSVSSFSSPNPSANPTRTPSSNPSILNSSPDEITLTVNSSNWKQVLSFLGVYSSSEVILASLDPSRMDTNTTRRPQPPTVPSPTIQPTRRPTTSPSHRGSAKPTSASPIQTRVPSLRPSLISTVTPTIIQTIRTPTKHPSERPSRTPTTIPTVRGSPIPTVSLPAVLLPLSEYAARYVNYRVGYVSMLNNEKKRKTDLLLTDKMLEEDGSRVKPSVDIKEDIIPSSVESEKHSIHHSRPSLYKNSEEEEGAISMSDSLDTNDYEISLVNMSEEEEGIAHSESHEASSSHSSSDDCFF
eukprot:gene8664-9376_t